MWHPFPRLAVVSIALICSIGPLLPLPILSSVIASQTTDTTLSLQNQDTSHDTVSLSTGMKSAKTDSAKNTVRFIEDSEEELLLQETEGPKKESAAEKSPDSVHTVHSADSVTIKALTGDQSPLQPSDTGSIQVSSDTGSAPAQDAFAKKNLKIDETRAINFSNNLKEYRSPKLAMLFSFLVPGLGQAYAKKYYKTALFGLLETGLIGGSIYYGIKANKKRGRAQDFADANYDPEKLFSFYRDMEVFLKTFVNTDTLKVKMPLVDQPSAMGIFSESLSVLKSKYADFKKLPRNSTERKDFDDFIKSIPVFVRGWRDCTPNFSVTGYDTLASDPDYIYKNYSKDTVCFINVFNKADGSIITNGTRTYGYSRLQKEYEKILNRAAQYDSYSTYLIITLVASHIISAVDALITAQSYNNKLLNKTSFWDRIHLDESLSYTSTGMRSTFSIRVSL